MSLLVTESFHKNSPETSTLAVLVSRVPLRLLVPMLPDAAAVALLCMSLSL